MKREVARDYPEWTAAMALLTVSEKLQRKIIKTSASIERDCRTVIQQLVSSKPGSVLKRTPYKTKEQKIWTQKRHSLLRRLVKD